MRCIFCKEEKSKDQFSSEHVFPESIGGSYRINTVCKECNSLLGEKVDSQLADHPWVRWIRYQLDLSGKKKKISRFAGELVENPTYGQGPLKATVIYNKSLGGSLGRIIATSFEADNRAEGDNWEGFVVDSGDKARFVDMIRQFCSKNKQPEPPSDQMAELFNYLKRQPEGTEFRIKIGERLLWRGKLMKADPNLVECTEDIGVENCKRAIVKIAYELAVEWLGPGYLEDPTGENLRRFVDVPSSSSPSHENAINGRVDLIGIPPQIGPAPDRIYSHMARICYSENVLVAEIIVFNVIRGCIIITETPTNYRLFIPHRLNIDPTKQTHRVHLLQGVVSEMKHQSPLIPKGSFL